MVCFHAQMRSTSLAADIVPRLVLLFLELLFDHGLRRDAGDVGYPAPKAY